MLSGTSGIRLEGDPILTKQCKFVDCTDDVLAHMKTLKREVGKHANIAGLAAPQMGFSERMFAYRNPYGTVKGLISPILVSHSKEIELDFEGCLSIPDKSFLIERFTSVLVEGIDSDTKTIVEVSATGFLARLLQHELDHLNGVLISHKIASK